LKVVALADENGREARAAFPRFRAFSATLQLMSLGDEGTFIIELLYMNRAACLWDGFIDINAKGTIAVGDGIGRATSRTRRSRSVRRAVTRLWPPGVLK